MKVVVVGGGLVGSAAALGLAAQGYAVTLLEGSVPRIQRGRLGVDMRNVALNPQTKRLLEPLGVWSQDSAVAYDTMRVWEETGTGCMNFNARELGCENLGWLLEMSPLQTSLYAACLASVEVVVGTLADIELEPQRVRLQTADGDVLTADFVVAADGADSRVREKLGIKTKVFALAQHALATVVETQEPHNGVAFQRFLRAGPLALLPARNVADADGSKNLVSVVWSQSTDLAQKRLALGDEAFCGELERASEGVLGRIIDVDQRVSFPLSQSLAATFTRDCKVVLIGDAARVVHPLAGLGVNIGFEDVLALLQVTLGGQGLARVARLKSYERARRSRSKHMISLLELLRASYEEKNPALTWMRNLAVEKLNNMHAVKHQIMREAMGLGPIAKVSEQ